jgi:polyisoprenyl-phosphate glycosyltransferase
MDIVRPTISVLIPAFNEEANVERAYGAVVEAFTSLPEYELEIVFTDNHSSDRTFEILSAIAKSDRRVRVLRFSRNVGYQRSLLAAYKAATGACSVQIDCDLQDPPHLIPGMIALWRQGHKVVYGIRRSSQQDSWFTALLRRAFYRLVRSISNDDLPLDVGEFRLVDRRILEELRKVEDTSPYLRGLISSMGFSQVGFPYDRQARVAGVSKFPLRQMTLLAIDGILNHSLIPLRLASLASLLMGTITFLLLLGYTLATLVFGQQWPRGFATTTLLILISMTMNAIFLGIVGEYVGRIFMQSKRRPATIVETSINDEGLEGRPAILLDMIVR